MGGACSKKGSKDSEQQQPATMQEGFPNPAGGVSSYYGPPNGQVVKESGVGCSGVQKAARIVRGDINLQFLFEPKILGTGFSGPVKVAVHRITGRKYAVKPFSKAGAKKDKINMLRNEAQIYLRLDHPNIARLIEVYEDDQRVYLVMELCSGGELYDRLCARRIYSESDARRVAIQMLSAVHYLHAHGVVHRDLKLENWLYQSEDEEADLKLIDFGFSKIWNPHLRRMQATCGTLAYVSPDTLMGGYTNACDMWSLGVVVYMLLVGYPPFYGNEEQMFDAILSGSYSLKGRRWEKVSSAARSFVRQLLEVNPEKRLSSKQAFAHPWISEQRSAMSGSIDATVLQEMKTFGQQQKLKRAALTMMAFSLTSDEIRGMHELFLAFDKSNEGTIRLEELVEVMQKHLDVSNEEIEKIFRSMDSSGDREVYYNDFLAVILMTRLDMHENLIREAFQKFDTDGSGFISLDNLQDVLGGQYKEEALKEIIDDADRDNNGVIDYEEFLAVVKSEANKEANRVYMHIVDRAVEGDPSRLLECNQMVHLKAHPVITDRVDQVVPDASPEAPDLSTATGVPSRNLPTATATSSVMSSSRNPRQSAMSCDANGTADDSPAATVTAAEESTAVLAPQLPPTSLEK